MLLSFSMYHNLPGEVLVDPLWWGSGGRLEESDGFWGLTEGKEIEVVGLLRHEKLNNEN